MNPVSGTQNPLKRVARTDACQERQPQFVFKGLVTEAPFPADGVRAFHYGDLVENQASASSQLLGGSQSNVASFAIVATPVEPAPGIYFADFGPGRYNVETDTAFAPTQDPNILLHDGHTDSHRDADGAVALPAVAADPAEMSTWIKRMGGFGVCPHAS